MSDGMRAALLALCGLGVVACAEAAQEPPAPQPPAEEQPAEEEQAEPHSHGEFDTGGMDPAEKGLADARKAIDAGEPRILMHGLPDFEMGDMDPEAGVPYEQHGCEVSEEFMAYENAFNAEILRAVKAGELDRLNLRHKVTTRDAVLAMFTRDEGHELSADTGPVQAPGGRFYVEVAHHERMDSDYLWVADRRARSRRPLTWLRAFGVRVLFSADGETMFLYDEEHSGVVQTHDLPNALFMQGWEGQDE